MHKLVTATQMRRCDNAAVSHPNVTEETLTVRAAEAMLSAFLPVKKPGSTLIVCGGGNNGADGAALALLLHAQGIPCRVVYICVTLSPVAALFRDKLLAAGISVSDNPAALDTSGADNIVDALLGIGCSRPATGRFEDAIRAINASPAFTLSADIPSGLPADAPFPSDVPFVAADMTVAFAAYKAAHLFFGADACGDVVLADIGIPVPCGADVIDSASDLVSFFPPRKKLSHKGSYGKLCIFGGSPQYLGAALLCHRAADAALRSGAGLAALAVPESLAPEVRSRIVEATLEIIPDAYTEQTVADIARKYDAVCAGMGMGDTPDTYRICAALARHCRSPLLLDADALNAAARQGATFADAACPVLLTPHAAEFSRLSGIPLPDVLSDPVAHAERYAAAHRCTVLLKGYATVVTDGARTCITVTGTPALAKGGSGDVLSGIIGSLLARGIPTLDAAVCGAALHGLAGRLAEQRLGSYSVLASDLIAALPQAIQSTQTP